jgi:NAD(P)-dependent dehydrogenase (short-subunit alcohol dehydrogenase family)
MEMRKTAVVTGGVSGLGLAVAECFVKKGLSVAIIGIMNEEGAKLEREFKSNGQHITYYECDVTDQEKTIKVAKQIFDDFGRIDILVNSAGIIRRTEAIDVRDNEIKSVIDVNLNGTVYMSQAVYPYMAKTGGSIVNFSSMLAHYGSKNLLSYAASKGGVVQVTKCLAVEWAGDGIRVNAVSPGYIETKLAAEATTNPDFREKIITKTPLKRFGTAMEVAEAVDFLSSEKSSFITGVVLPVDGGLLAGDPSMFPPSMAMQTN